MFNKEKKIIKIDGMKCSHCTKKVESALSSIENVKKVKVNLENKEAIISSKVEIEDIKIKKSIEDLGYKIISISK